MNRITAWEHAPDLAIVKVASFDDEIGDKWVSIVAMQFDDGSIIVLLTCDGLPVMVDSCLIPDEVIIDALKNA